MRPQGDAGRSRHVGHRGDVAFHLVEIEEQSRSVDLIDAIPSPTVARKRGRELPDLRLRVRGEYRGAGFDRIIVEATSSEPELVRSVLDQAIRTSYVSNTIRGQPEIEYRVEPAVASHGEGPPPPRR